MLNCNLGGCQRNDKIFFYTQIAKMSSHFFCLEESKDEPWMLLIWITFIFISSPLIYFTCFVLPESTLNIGRRIFCSLPIQALF